MRFKPTSAATALMLVPLLSFCWLGKWQLDRANEKDRRIAEFSQARQVQGLPDAASAGEFTRLTLRGRFSSDKHIFADNQVLDGRAGVHVYSPFKTNEGSVILVNRGWLPMPADRNVLPAVENMFEEIGISGHLGPIPGPGRQLGKTDDVNPQQWPQLLTYPDLDLIAVAMNTPLYPLVLFMDDSSPAGFDGRQWKPVFMRPSRHRAYAFQWFAMAVAVVLGWVLLAFRRGQQT